VEQPPYDEFEEEDVDDPRGPERPPRGRRPPRPEDLVRGLVPEDFDWQDLVRTYPWPAMVVAFLGGYVLARTKGDEIVEALSDFASQRISDHVNTMLRDDVL
jgi:hypothetical protein